MSDIGNSPQGGSDHETGGYAGIGYRRRNPKDTGNNNRELLYLNKDTDGYLDRHPSTHIQFKFKLSNVMYSDTEQVQ